MNQDNALINQTIKNNHLDFGHFKLVAVVALALLGITFLKNPSLFSFKGKNVLVVSQDRPRYYAYVPPAEDAMPMVAGASTQPSGPSVINEDGSLSKVGDEGLVLGADTQDILLTEKSLHIVPDTQQSVSDYISSSKSIEQDYFNNFSFEQALEAHDDSIGKQEHQKIDSIASSLSEMTVPVSFEKYHQYKMLRYHAAADMLKFLPSAQTNPQPEAEAFQSFLKYQQLEAGEIQKLETNFSF